MKRSISGALVALSFCTASSGEPRVASVAPRAVEPARREPARADRVVLVTIDGVRWQEIFRGADRALAPGSTKTAAELTPNLHRLFFDEGTALGDPSLGAGVAASGPRFVSLPAYVELMTGAPSGCVDNECVPKIAWTIPEHVLDRARPAPAVFASWERIDRAVPSGDVLVRAGRAADDASSPEPGWGRYRPDHDTARLALEHFVSAKPRFLWIALGDTDEWAHRHDYASYLGALARADETIGALVAAAEKLDADGGHTVVFVTTDHGRDEGFADHGGPASSAVWLAAHGAPIAARGSIGAREARHLRDVAPTIGALLGAPVASCAGCGVALDELL